MNYPPPRKTATPVESGPGSSGVRGVPRLRSASLILAGLLAGSAATPATAHYWEPLDYVAFGDSYTSGIGAGPATVSPLYPLEPTPCYQASPGYVDVLDARDGVELDANAACGGASAAVVPAQVEVAAKAGKLSADTDLVTITAGGNDVRFGAILAECLRPKTLEECKAAVKVGETVARTEVSRSLTNAYAAIRAKAPHATIAALGYPHLFSPEFGENALITVDNAKAFNKGTDTLNKVIRKSARDIPGTEYVDVTDEFDGHGIGSPHPWIIFNPNDAAAPSNFHPNATGYAKGYARAVVREAGVRALPEWR